jgi:transcription antitermination factor NusG
MNLWYALHVKPRFEQLILQHLSRRGHEVLAPTYTLKQPERNTSISLPLFPAYVFCRFDIRARSAILLQPGVNSIARSRVGPNAMDDREIESIRRVVECSSDVRPAPYQTEGRKILIQRGPLHGMTGIVASDNRSERSSERFIVSLRSLQRAVSVGIEADWITPDSFFSEEDRALGA